MFGSVWILLGAAAVAWASTASQEHTVWVNLMNGYDPMVHPHEANDAVDVHFDLELTRLVDFDTEHQVLTVDAVVVQEWHDSRLEWDLATNGNVKYVNAHFEDVWHPDVVAVDSAAEYTALFDGRVDAHVDNTGTVTYVTPVEFHFYCHTHWHVQPNEDVNCTVEFTSWKYAKEEMDLNFLENSHKQLHQLDKDFFHNDFNYEWSLVSVTEERVEHEYGCCPGEHFPLLKYHLVLHHNDHCHE